jgi:hypothetical protein
MIMIKTLLKFFALFFLLASCSAERKLANKLSRETDKIAVMLITTDQIYADQMTIPDVEGWDDMDPNIQDSVRFASGRVVKDLSGDQYLNIFRQSYVKELSRYGIKVFGESELEGFHSWEGDAWLVNLAQVEVQESVDLVRDEEVVNGSLYAYDFPVTNVNIGSWFEVARMNASSDAPMEVLFASYDISDDYQGYFTQNFVTGEVGYSLMTDTLNLEKFYKAIAFTGRLYAGYTFDHILNIRVKNQLEGQERSGRFYRFDPYRRFLFTTENDRFIPIE